jgi:16S rRNA G527 N7-methylase RsmG
MEVSVSRYLNLLWEENKNQNLFSRQTGNIDLELHVQDSLQGLKFLRPAGQNGVDIGSGAGFPAIILA